MKKFPFGAAPDSDVNVRSLSDIVFRKGAEKEYITASGFFEYFQSQTDILPVGFGELHGFIHHFFFSEALGAAMS